MNAPLYIGIILLVGLVGGKLASKVNLPSVTGYIIFGLLLGPSFTNIITKEMIKSFQFVNQLALGILALSIGTELHRLTFKKYGKRLFLVSLGDEMITFFLTASFTYLLGLQLQFAVVLGVLAMTVSPSGVISVIRECGATGNFSKNVITLVAIDNLLCIIFFGVVMAVLQGAQSTDMSGLALATQLIVEIGSALILGIIAGIIISYVMKQSPNKSKLLVFLLGIVLLNTGIADHFNLSALLINMATGATIVNLVNRKLTLASTLDRIELPVFVLFLTLAGAKLDLSIVSSVGIVGLGYIAGRLMGKVGGTFIFSELTNLDKSIRNNIGMALTPQAGVAIGLSILAEEKLPSSGGVITGILLTGVIFFEIAGPLLLKKSLKNTGEISAKA